MSSRGSRSANGHITTNEYHLDHFVDDARVLKGNTNKQHGLPDYSHTENRKYIKENPDGSFREMRIYNENHMPIIEIANHVEPSITGNRHDVVLHFHTFDDNLKRSGAKPLGKDSEVYKKYKNYLGAYGL